MIYKLRADRSKYLNFYISALEIELKIGDYFLLDRPLWADFWQPVDAVFHDDSDEQTAIRPPDITPWFATTCIALNTRAYELLHNHIQPYGELLPVNCEGITYWLLHTTKKLGLEYVDLNKSQREIIEECEYIDAQSLVFKEEKLADQLIFLTEFNGYKNIYCTEKFKSLVEKAGLKGLIFSTDLAGITEP